MPPPMMPTRMSDAAVAGGSAGAGAVEEGLARALLSVLLVLLVHALALVLQLKKSSLDGYPECKLEFNMAPRLYNITVEQEK